METFKKAVLEIALLIFLRALTRLFKNVELVVVVPFSKILEKSVGDTVLENGRKFYIHFLKFFV